jgi:thiol-disulfide isomerase/thioredoxin
MDRADWTRRGIVAGLGALPASAAFASQPVEPSNEPSIFAGGPFANNMVAQDFVAPPPGLVLPKRTPLFGKGAPKSLDVYRGKTIILSLWAEWCTPCVQEMPVFDKIIQLICNDKFQIVPVMSGSNLDDPSEVKPFLTKIGAATLPLIMDGSPDRDRLQVTLAKTGKDNKPALPCNLLIDPSGVIRGRSIGGATFKNERGEFSIWASPDSVKFVTALANGLMA